MNKPWETKDLETELLQDFALIKLTNLTLNLKVELNEIPLEELDQLIHAFTKIGGHPDEVLFLQNLIALKIAQKNLEVGHHFNRRLKPLSGSAVEQQPQ